MLVLLAALFASASNVLTKWVLGRMPFDRFLAARSFGAVASLTVMFLVMRTRIMIPWWAVVLLFVSGFVWPGLVNVLVHHAMKRLPVNVSRPVFQSYPAMAFLGSLILGDAVLSLTVVSGIVLALGGAAAFGYFKPAVQTVKVFRLRDVLLTFTGALVQAVGVLIWRYIRNNGLLDAVTLNFIQNCGTFVLFAVVMNAVDLKTRSQGHARSAGWGALGVSALAGVLVFGLGNTCFMAALGFKGMNPGVAGSIYTLGVPLTALFAWMFLRERWTWKQGVAGASVVAGVAVLALA